jgi:predicted NACHT family NTPase
VPVVEVAHEALIRHWQRLRQWLNDRRDIERQRRQIESEAKIWEEKGRQRDYLLFGYRLGNAAVFLESYPEELSATARELIEESNSAKERELRDKEQLTNSKLKEQAARVLQLLPVRPIDALVLAIQTVGMNLDEYPGKLRGEVLPEVQSSLLKAVEADRESNLLKGHKGSVYSVAFSPDPNTSKTIVSGGEDGTVRLWDCAGKALLATFKGHKRSVRSVAFSPNGKTIVSGGEDGTVRLWDCAGKALLAPFTGHESYVCSVAFSPNGKTIVSGGEDGTVRLWDCAGKALLAPFTGHESYVRSVAFSPNGKTIVSGGEDGTVRLWDCAGNALGARFKGHEGYVRSVAFSPDGQTIVSGGWDGTVRLWDSAGKTLGAPFTGHKNPVFSVAFSPDGQTIVSGGADGTVRLWRGNWEAWLQVACDWLRYDSISQNPQSEVERQACETCRKYVWEKGTGDGA